MKLLTKLLKSAQRKYLQARIAYEQPELAKLEFEFMLKFFIEDAIAAHVEKEVEGDLPKLVRQAIAYTSTRSAGYYHAQLLVSQALCQKAEEKSLDWLLAHQERKRERDGYKEIAEKVIEIIENPLARPISDN